MAGIIEIITQAVWLMLPAYISNPTAVVFGGGTPIDFGKNWKDGKRILGEGKTFRGLIGGTICGLIIGIIQMQYVPFEYLGNFTLLAVFSLSFGALLGDMVKSFFKRRLSYDRGMKLPFIDQLDFVAGAWVLTYLLEPEWFSGNFTLWILIVVIVLTPILHRVTNIIGYHMKLKKEPW